MDEPYLAEIRVVPTEVTMEMGEEQQFEATGYDQFDDPKELGNPIWEAVKGDIVTEGTTCTFTATEAGDGSVVVYDGDLGPDPYGFADIHINSPTAVAVESWGSMKSAKE